MQAYVKNNTPEMAYKILQEMVESLLIVLIITVYKLPLVVLSRLLMVI